MCVVHEYAERYGADQDLGLEQLDLPEAWHYLKLLPEQIVATLEQAKQVPDPGFAERVRADEAITDIVNIGIGGSDLGPQMATLALGHLAAPGRRLHFVSNVDGHELASVVRGLDARRTLFLIASKTFTTIETMTNARSALQWFQAQGGTDVARHFAALTTNVAAAGEFGITTTFGFWDWVGGRYSMWSAIGLPVAIAIGAQGFQDLLAGAHAMDQHFQTAPLESNLPVRLGLLDVWYRNFLNYTSRSIAPYHSALRRLPAYLQQLEMESNGKRVDREGRALTYGTSPVLWGEPGTNGQHAYFQLIHQGTHRVPVDFIGVRHTRSLLPLAEQHQRVVLQNMTAQAQALALGRDVELTMDALHAEGYSEVEARSLCPHRTYVGNTPSSIIWMDSLTPEALGALIVLYEHKVFCQAALWDICAFDQWGVELGKTLFQSLTPSTSS